MGGEGLSGVFCDILVFQEVSGVLLVCAVCR